MPNLDNAKKALRQSKKHEANNRRYKNRIKKIARQIDDLVKDGKNSEAEKILPVFYKTVDKAAKKNILHKNTAARRKSLFSKKVVVKNQEATTAADNSSQAR